MKTFLPALKLYIVLTVITGFFYPLLMTGYGQVVMKDKASGSLLKRDQQVIGSALIAQKFQDPKFFWPRPSAVDYNPMPSGASNLAPTSEALLKAIEERRQQGRSAELLFASGSGLDPEISPDAARSQIDRIAQSRGFDENRKDILRKLVDDAIIGRQFGFLGEARVNVLQLNLSLQEKLP